jgi:hypothetical protein
MSNKIVVEPTDFRGTERRVRPDTTQTGGHHAPITPGVDTWPKTIAEIEADRRLRDASKGKLGKPRSAGF